MVQIPPLSTPIQQQQQPQTAGSTGSGGSFRMELPTEYNASNMFMNPSMNLMGMTMTETPSTLASLAPSSGELETAFPIDTPATNISEEAFFSAEGGMDCMGGQIFKERPDDLRAGSLTPSESWPGAPSGDCGDDDDVDFVTAAYTEPSYLCTKQNNKSNSKAGSGRQAPPKAHKAVDIDELAKNLSNLGLNGKSAANSASKKISPSKDRNSENTSASGRKEDRELKSTSSAARKSGVSPPPSTVLQAPKINATITAPSESQVCVNLNINITQDGNASPPQPAAAHKTGKQQPTGVTSSGPNGGVVSRHKAVRTSTGSQDAVNYDNYNKTSRRVSGGVQQPQQVRGSAPQQPIPGVSRGVYSSSVKGTSNGMGGYSGVQKQSTGKAVKPGLREKIKNSFH